MFIPENVSEKGVRWSSIISSGVEGGVSTNKIISYFRQSGIGYDQNLMVKDIRQFRIAKEGAEAVKRLPGFLVPPVEYIKKPQQTTVQERYAVVVTGEFENLDTGESEFYTKTITFDSMMKKSEMVDAFGWVMADRPYPEELAMISGKVEYIFKGERK